MSNLDRAPEGRLWESNAAIAADLLRIPLPGIDAIRSGKEFCREQL
jgi:hypothetical protein